MKTDAIKTRDERFRRNVLAALYLSRRNSPDGSLSGVALLDTANAPMAYDQKIEDPAEALTLIRDVCALGLATEDAGESRRRGEIHQLRHCKFTITEKGVSLYLENIPPVPGVWDERVS